MNKKHLNTSGSSRSLARAEEEAEVFAPIHTRMEDAVKQGVFPGAVLLLGQDGKVLFKRAYGVRSLKGFEESGEIAMSLDTVFDLASLSGVVVTTTMIMKLIEQGKLSLTDRVARYIQSFGVHGKSKIMVEHLLSHTSGLNHWHPFFEELLKSHSGNRRGILTSRGARDYVFHAINRAELKFTPGSVRLYSDLGLIVLGELIELLPGLTLDQAAQKNIFQPLSMKSTSFIDLTLIRRRGIHPVKDLIAPTEECHWRKRILCGEVHDDNAWVMGGIAGQAGVFSNAADLHLFATEILKVFHDQSDYLRGDTVRTFLKGVEQKEEGNLLPLGWDFPNEENGLSSCQLSRTAVGHNGFTGCSLWLEPERGLDIVLLSNRVHPSRSNKKIRQFRVEIIDAILAAVAELAD